MEWFQNLFKDRLAFYGAATSTITLLWKFYEFYLTKAGRIKIYIDSVYDAHFHENIEGGKSVIDIRLVNMTDKTRHIEKIKFALANYNIKFECNKQLVYPIELIPLKPYKLSIIVQEIIDFKNENELNIIGDDVEEVFVVKAIESTNKYYTARAILHTHNNRIASLYTDKGSLPYRVVFRLSIFIARFNKGVFSNGK